MANLLYPLRYFRATNSQKFKMDAFGTLFVATAIFLPFVLFPSANFFGSGGFVGNLLILTSALTGFYVAALVAAATFGHPDLDKVIIEGAVSIKEKDHSGAIHKRDLTRREFATLVFGYLAFSAMGFTIFASAALPIATAMPSRFGQIPYLQVEAATVVSWAARLLVSVWMAHLLVVTCLGLYYLMDRLYRRQPRVLTSKDQSESDRAA